MILIIQEENELLSSKNVDKNKDNDDLKRPEFKPNIHKHNPDISKENLVKKIC